MSICRIVVFGIGIDSVVNEVINIQQIAIDMCIGSFSLDNAFLMASLDTLGIVLSPLAHQQQTIVYNAIILFMHFVETKGRTRELSIVRRTRIVQTSRSGRYIENSEESSQESPALLIYSLLLSVIRKQTRKPFNLFKQYLMFSEEEEESIQVGNKLAGCELQIVEENIRAVCTLIRQRLLIQGFLSIKMLYQKKLRVEQVYYNEENLTVLYKSISTFQTFYLKWEGFGRLYQHFRGNRLLKLNLSKIQAISNDCTSKELDDFHPFLNREVEVIHSYIIDRSSQNDSTDFNQNKRLIGGHQQIKEHEEEASEEANNHRSVRKSYTKYDVKKSEKDQLDSKVLVTHKKQAERHQAGSTAKAKEGEDTHRQTSSQEIYLIRDYKAKGKTTEPSNFIKVPVLSENVKIVEILTARKKTHKRRSSKAQVEIQRQICQNCKFCVQMRQRKEMLRVVQRRFQVINIQNNHLSHQTQSGAHSHNASAYHNSLAYNQQGLQNNHLSINSQVGYGNHSYNHGGSQLSVSSHGATNNYSAANSNIFSNNILTNNKGTGNIHNIPIHTLSVNQPNKSHLSSHSQAVSTHTHAISARSHSISSQVGIK